MIPTNHIALVAAIPWRKPSELTGKSYRPGDIATLRGRAVLSLLHPPGQKPKPEVLYGIVTRGRATPTGYRLEIALNPHREEARQLLAEIDEGFGPPHISPVVERTRLVGVGFSALPTWPEARLRRSPLPLTPEELDRALALLSEAEASKVG